MHRVARHCHVEPVHIGMAMLPRRIAERIDYLDVLTGVDPVFAGLHRFRDASYGRSYADVAHVAYDFHQEHLPRDRRTTTLVLPQVVDVRTVMHELGHVIDETLRFEHTAKPVTSYADTNRTEAFAEAFAAWALPFGHGYGAAKDRLYNDDRRTVELFEWLASA